MYTTIVILLAILMFIFMKLFIVVPMREEVVVQRLGKYLKTLKPGFHLIIPFIDLIAYRQEIREQVLDVVSQSCITADNVQVEVDGLVYIKVIDSYKASYGIDNYQAGAINLAQTTMRSEIGKITLDNTFSERDNLNDRIVTEIDKASDAWGVKVMRYEIKNITPSSNVIITLEKQMEAVRQKRAEITISDAAKVSKINLSEGEKQSSINLSNGDKQRRINEATGRAQAIKMVSAATATGMKRIAEAIQKPGGAEAVSYQLVEQYIEEFGRILSSSKISVLPTDIANLKGLYKSIKTVD